MDERVEAQAVRITEAIQDQIRKIAREEIASLCGLVLRRLQDGTWPGDAHLAKENLAAIFGEALADFSGHTKGEEPGTEERP